MSAKGISQAKLKRTSQGIWANCSIEISAIAIARHANFSLAYVSESVKGESTAGKYHELLWSESKVATQYLKARRRRSRRKVDNIFHAQTLQIYTPDMASCHFTRFILCKNNYADCQT